MSLRNALTCRLEHDSCQKTAKYKLAGQNIALLRSAGKIQVEEAIQKSTKLWHDEYKNVPSLNEIHKLGSSSATQPIGHWTQLIQSKADRIGCSVVEFVDEEGWESTLIGCNYSAGSVVDYPIFMFGAPGSKCKTGINSKYPGLCSPAEDFSKHRYGKLYFDNKALPSPVLEQWLKNGKKLNL